MMIRAGKRSGLALWRRATRRVRLAPFCLFLPSQPRFPVFAKTRALRFFPRSAWRGADWNSNSSTFAGTRRARRFRGVPDVPGSIGFRPAGIFLRPARCALLLFLGPISLVRRAQSPKPVDTKRPRRTTNDDGAAQWRWVHLCRGITARPYRACHVFFAASDVAGRIAETLRPSPSVRSWALLVHAGAGAHGGNGPGAQACAGRFRPAAAPRAAIHTVFSEVPMMPKSVRTEMPRAGCGRRSGPRLSWTG